MNQIIDVLVRILSVIFLITSCGLLMYFSHEQLKVSLINQQDPIATVPVDAGLVIESNKIKNTLVNMSETNLIWSKLLEHQDFQEFDRKIKHLVALFIKDKIIEESLSNKKVIISFHPGNKQVEMFVATNTSNKVYRSILSLLKNEGYAYKQTEKAIIECKDQSGKKFYLTYNEPFLMYSSAKMLLDQSLVQLDKGSGLHKNIEYLQVNNTKSSSSDLHIFLQSSQFIRIAANFLNNSAIQNWQEGAFFNGWLELDLNLKPNSLQVSGLSLLNDPGAFDQSVNRQKPSAEKKYNILPSNVNSLMSYTISNMSDFIIDHTIIESSTLDVACQCNSEALIEDLIGDELIYTELKNKEGIHKAMIFKKADDYKSARPILKILGAGDSLMNVIGGDKVYQLKNNLFTNILGIKLSKKELFYQEKGDHVILSTIDGIRVFNRAWKKNKNNNDFTNFRYYSDNYLTNFSSVDYFWKKNEFFNQFNGYLKTDYKETFQRLSNILSEIDGVSFQASASTPMYNFHSYAISTGNSTEEESSQLWVADIDSISRVPELMKNHRTNTLELLVQDENNVIYLINATGKIKWSKQLEGQIIGDVTQMDFYKNGKWQMLFNTRSNIHLLDINGHEVSGFPFNLKYPASNSVSVFDYENKGAYRFLVCAEDKKMYNFDKTGKSLPDWRYPSSKSIVNTPIRHFVVEHKDYLFSYDIRGYVYLYDRRGNVRYETSITSKPNKSENFRLKKDFNIENSSLIYIDSSNFLIQSRFNGKTDTVKIKTTNEGQSIFTNLFEWGNDQLIYYSVSDGHNMEIYGPDKELQFIEYLDFTIGDNIHVLGKKEQYILLSNEKENLIYLYDGDYNPTNVFSVPGSSRSIIGDMNFDGINEVITITEDGQIIAYSIDSNFN